MIDDPIQDPDQTKLLEVLENMEVETDNEQASISTMTDSGAPYSQALLGSAGPRRTNSALTQT
ncbi:522_t:CDS:1, partial [Gigaspora rosea]